MTNISPRRQENVAGGRIVHHRVRVTREQEQALVKLAAARGVTIAKLLVDTALSAPEVPMKTVYLEVAAIHRLLFAEALDIAKLAKMSTPDPQVVSAALDSISWRDRQLIGRYGWAQ